MLWATQPDLVPLSPPAAPTFRHASACPKTWVGLLGQLLLQLSTFLLIVTASLRFFPIPLLFVGAATILHILLQHLSGDLGITRAARIYSTTSSTNRKIK